MGTNYVGTYSVVNATEDVISNVNVEHVNNDSPDPSACAATLTVGGAVYSTLHSNSDYHDYWNISFVRNGNTYTKSDFEANYETEDMGLGVVIILYPTKFSVIFPNSTNNSNIDYDN